ncbi:hypothetical protein RB195_004463 [Necator americanus]|uniref:Secreted protein n=1 Tax=Necator americanus TaxID=51031 RepID=A0ABR1BI35_NECAM
MKVLGILLPVLAVRCPPWQWTAISRNGEKARSVAPTCIERRQPPKTPGHLHSAALQKPQILLAGHIVTGDGKWVLYAKYTQKRA